jgi:aerobic-type carbon monoxide dehydrogenase small subunit (CoxS/CutS family)
LKIDLSINYENYVIEVSPAETLLEVLRRLGFKSVKKSCETGDCGACTVLMDGRAVASCIVLAVQADGCSVKTVEGLARDGKLHPVQDAFLEAGAPQCGFCTPGMIMSAVGLLSQNTQPTRAQVREAISGNICRCSGYVKVVDAILAAAAKLKDEDRESGK